MKEMPSFRILLLGDSTVGKTSFLNRYLGESFENFNLATHGIESRFQQIKVDNQEIMLRIYDTAGEEKYKSLVKNYYRGADGIILIYDIGNKNSFESITQWIENIKEATKYENLAIVVCANKCDLEENEKQVKSKEKDELENEIDLKIIETSAKLDINVKETFDNLVKKMMKLKKEIKNENLSLENTIKIKKKNNNNICLNLKHC